MALKSLLTVIAALCVLLLPLFPAAGEEFKPIRLLQPQMDGGRPLMQVLKDRTSGRAFSPEELPLQTLSNLLWAAFGVNRPDSGKRTAPSAMNWQEIDIYIALSTGLYRYDATANVLKPVLAKDVRDLTGKQAFVKEAPVNLIFVADFSRMGKAKADDKIFYSAADAGFICQNVYLYCASEGLSTVVRGAIDRQALATRLKLRPDQRVIIAQSVGYPTK